MSANSIKQFILKIIQIIKQPLVLFIIISNLFVLFNIVFWHYDTGLVLAIYLVEIIFVSLLNLIKIIIIDWKYGLLIMPIYILFYSLIFLTIFGLIQFISIKENTIIASASIIVLAASHLLSFFINFIGKKEYSSSHTGKTKFDLIFNQILEPAYLFLILFFSIIVVTMVILPIFIICLLLVTATISCVAYLLGIQNTIMGIDRFIDFYNYCTESTPLIFCFFNSWFIMIALVIIKTLFAVIGYSKKHQLTY